MEHWTHENIHECKYFVKQQTTAEAQGGLEVTPTPSIEPLSTNKPTNEAIEAGNVCARGHLISDRDF